MWKNNRKVCVMAQKGYVMSDELTNKLRKIYDILFSVLLIVTGIRELLYRPQRLRKPK
jgi:hypothetical protein